MLGYITILNGTVHYLAMSRNGRSTDLLSALPHVRPARTSKDFAPKGKEIAETAGLIWVLSQGPILSWMAG
jgi:hypothetical protein